MVSQEKKNAAYFVRSYMSQFWSSVTTAGAAARWEDNKQLDSLLSCCLVWESEKIYQKNNFGKMHPDTD